MERAGKRAQKSADNMATGGGEVQVGLVYSYITRALIETQGKEVTQAWRNSSVRTAVERAGTRAQESADNMAAGGGEVQVGLVITRALIGRKVRSDTGMAKLECADRSGEGGDKGTGICRQHGHWGWGGTGRFGV